MIQGTDSHPIFEQESDWTFVPSSTKDSSDLVDHGDKNESRTTSSETKAHTSDEASHVAVAYAESGSNECPTEKGSKPESGKGTKAKKRKITKDECTAKDIDKLFDAAEEKIVESLKEVETTNLSKVSSELIDKMDEFDEDQANAVAEAFKDDDVIGDFEEDKEFDLNKEKVKNNGTASENLFSRSCQALFLSKPLYQIEEGERPKDVDLTLQGWGCWVGPGMTERKRRKQFVIKAKQKRRKDKNRPGVIIKETQETLTPCTCTESGVANKKVN
ncbi:hypothetical protein ANCDUO_11840 [Ancylostoma duodenale]|uniref:Uncharacterized protein n=1 Tax=Ancylostoma duodenale TaxID=51022 RepID=A0A0C2GAE8_9BILA|nr:hypothetical protein ANCDUO_11840 [Ancylostoma duodenale]